MRAARASRAGAPQLQRRIDASAQGAAPAMDVRASLNIEGTCVGRLRGPT